MPPLTRVPSGGAEVTVTFLPSAPAATRTRPAPEAGVDHRAIDWTQVNGSTFVLHQRFCYEYPTAIRDLRHRLVVVPPPRHGDQHRVDWHMRATGADAEIRHRRDRFGNVLVEARADRVRESIEFEVQAVVERSGGLRPTALPGSSLRDRRWTAPSALTAPDARLREAARELVMSGTGGLDLARRITTWTSRALRYSDGVTNVRTTAAEALAAGGGVCQDYAHVMLALCRLAGLPARYVSGHLLGEGGSHAWVEVLVEAAGQLGQAYAVPFDATHDRQPGLSYLTVAVGRDYLDVAPTSGTYNSPVSGRLSVTKRLGLASVEWLTA